LASKTHKPERPKASGSFGRTRRLKTLDRVLSKAGLGSRTEARGWIGGGRVRVNGKLIQTPDHWVDLDRDKVTLDGKPVLKAESRYVLLYKPKGYVTTHRDPQGRPTVYELIPDVDQFVGTVGRLDLETSGLLLLTNDNQLAEALTNPEHKVPKTYLVKASRPLTDAELTQLARGVQLSDGITRPAAVRRIRDAEKYTFLELTITEGRNRQVRRMIETLGCKVLKLVRTNFGPLTLQDLRIGEWRELKPQEVNLLKKVSSTTRKS
jgi:pseudouridine synthase